MRIYHWLALFLLAGGIATQAQANIIVSLPPIHSLAAALMEGSGEQQISLLEGNQSPHGWQMRPSQARLLTQAELVIWVGPELEAFLVKPLETFNPRQQLVLLDIPNLIKHASRAGGHDDHHHHDHHEEAETDSINPHIWLDPKNGEIIARAIHKTLVQRNPERRALYDRNLARLSARLQSLTNELARKMRPVRGTPYIAFHDAFSYFEARFGLEARDIVLPGPDQRAGLRRLTQLRQQLRQANIACIFSEPHGARAVDRMIEGTKAKHVRLDLLGTGFASGMELYPAMLRKLADDMYNCLADSD